MKTTRLAYYDTFAGLIPCRVLSVRDAYVSGPLAGCSDSTRITVKLTATRGAYKRGETIESDALKIIPRSHVRGGRSPRIIGGYRWPADPQPTPAALNAIFQADAAGSRTAWFAEYRANGSRLAVFYPPAWSPVEAADKLRGMGLSGHYSSLSGPCLEFPADWEPYAAEPLARTQPATA